MKQSTPLDISVLIQNVGVISMVDDCGRRSFTIVCDGECGSPVEATLEVHSTIYGLRNVLVCQGCGFIQTEETMQEVLSPKYKPPILHYYSGWIYADNSDYQLWKNLLSHDCRVGEGLHLVTIDNNYFFREIFHNEQR